MERKIEKALATGEGRVSTRLGRAGEKKRAVGDQPDRSFKLK
jgi:hypothetical protein